MEVGVGGGVGGVGDDGGFWGLAQTTQLCFTFY